MNEKELDVIVMTLNHKYLANQGISLLSFNAKATSSLHKVEEVGHLHRWMLPVLLVHEKSYSSNQINHTYRIMLLIQMQGIPSQNRKSDSMRI